MATSPPKFSINWPPGFESHVDRDHLKVARKSVLMSRSTSKTASRRGNPLAKITPAPKEARHA